jgi:hypothetical protein
MVNGVYTIKFSFTISDTVSNTDTITIAFPVPSSMSYDNGTINSNFNISSSITTYNLTSGILSIYMNVSRIFAQNTSLILNVGNYTAPPST